MPACPIQSVVLAAAPPADLPWSVYVAAGLALVVGLVIWLAGGRLMRPAFIALGAIIGASLAHLLPQGLAQWIGAWVLAGIGGVVGALVGWLAFRVLVANTLAVVIAVVSALAVAAWVRGEAPADDRAPAGDATGESPADESSPEDGSLEERIARQQIEGAKGALADAIEKARVGIEEAAAEDGEAGGSIADLTVERGKQTVKVFAARSWQSLVAFWNHDLTPRGRAYLLLALSLGYLGGLVLGFALPKRAAAVTTAMIGPAVWMPAAAYFVVALDLPVAQRIPSSPLLWLIAWAALAAMGLMAQVLGSRKRKAEKAAS